MFAAMMSNNSTHCYHFLNNTDYLVIDGSIFLYSASVSIGAVSALTAIVFILVAKAHNEFIYRLILYMAVDAVIGCLVSLAHKFEIEYSIRFEIALPTYLLKLYLVYVYSFLLCWLGLYLFSLAVFRVQLKKTKHEAIGLVTVLVTPLTFLWVIVTVLKCEDNKSMKLTYFLNTPHFVSILLSCLFIGAVLLMLCKNAVNRAENTLQQQHRKALRKIIPFVVFVMAYQIADIIYMGILASQLCMVEENKKVQAIYTTALWPAIPVSLPILLVYEPRIRHRIKCRKPQWRLTRSTNIEHFPTIHQSTGVSQPSDTHYSVQHESTVSSTCGDTSHYIAASPTVHAEHERQPLLSN